MRTGLAAENPKFRSTSVPTSTRPVSASSSSATDSRADSHFSHAGLAAHEAGFGFDPYGRPSASVTSALKPWKNEGWRGCAIKSGVG